MNPSVVVASPLETVGEQLGCVFEWCQAVRIPIAMNLVTLLGLRVFLNDLFLVVSKQLSHFVSLAHVVREFTVRVVPPNDPSSATAATGRGDGTGTRRRRSRQRMFRRLRSQIEYL